MKKINKTPGPNALTHFAANNPTARWEPDFKDENGGDDYHAIRQQIFDDQAGLCAYCETKVDNLPINKQRIEHFHSKSDDSNSSQNWGLDWNNIIGVCIGGEDADKSKHPRPANLSCDAHKNHLISKEHLSAQCEGYLLNPLNISATPCLFNLDKRTGELLPNDTVCQQVAGIENNFSSVRKLVEETIKALNINCDRLKDQRLAVRNEYNRQVKAARKKKDREVFTRMAVQWFQNKWPSFFTTRRLLLGQYAEAYLETIDYNG
ncbi:MAG: TIGR02646 family protein [Candidatus Parabeggiatoa sp. nov. 3]|nr:MAG: TIGR02646 family protein [Gammaproteobacteria bacterium]RKZ55055.1 MAG: TIGR02646 family protein [Gammaproteobacteria bacterium]RKZ86221.1 MAG: TIGR02646 family protein [Gammaproteobacteria bacterium]HEW98157.1 TIGR02646 family protein [Beggiatoa sp.]